MARPRTSPRRLGSVTVDGVVVGRDKKVVVPEQVRELASYGLTDKELADYFGISAAALVSTFDDELILGRHDIKIKLRKAMLYNATEKMQPSVQIFLAKNILGMRDTPIDTEDTKPLPWQDDF